MDLRRPGFCLGLCRSAKVLTACSNKILSFHRPHPRSSPVCWVEGAERFQFCTNSPGQCSGQLGRDRGISVLS